MLMVLAQHNYGKNPRQHIWTYAAGVTENSVAHTPNNCPCSDANSIPPQEFVGDRYYTANQVIPLISKLLGFFWQR